MLSQVLDGDIVISGQVQDQGFFQGNWEESYRECSQWQFVEYLRLSNSMKSTGIALGTWCGSFCDIDGFQNNTGTHTNICITTIYTMS
jgi:hypothetical protein